MKTNNFIPPTQNPNNNNGPTVPDRFLKLMRITRVSFLTIGFLLLGASLAVKLFGTNLHESNQNRNLIFGAVFSLIVSAVADAFLSKRGRTDSKRLSDFPISWKDSSKKD